MSADTDVILSEDRILDLQEEQRRLYSRRTVIQERMDEITRMLVASGEARLRENESAFMACTATHLPEIPCAACGYDQRDTAASGPARQYVAPVETGEPWRGPAQGDWENSR